MPEYRLYRLTQGNHIVGPPDTVSFDTDDEAIQHARQLVDGVDIEVWDGARLVSRIKSEDST